MTTCQQPNWMMPDIFRGRLTWCSPPDTIFPRAAWCGLFGASDAVTSAFALGSTDRSELQAQITSRNIPRNPVWRAGIVLATSDGHGTFEIMRRARTSKPTVWRWQQRYLDEGAAGLKRDTTRPSRVPPLPVETRLKVITRMVQEVPPDATHRSRSPMAEAMGISPSGIGRIAAGKADQ